MTHDRQEQVLQDNQISTKRGFPVYRVNPDLAGLDDVTCFHVMRALGSCRHPSQAVLDTLRIYVRHPHRSVLVRAWGALQLGRIGGGPEVRVLVRLAAGDDVQLVQAAVRGLGHACMRHETTRRFVLRLVDHHRAEIRCAAMGILAHVPAQLEDGLEVLLSRVGRELNADVVDLLMHALGKYGSAAAEVLVGFLKSSNIASITTAAGAIAHLGIEGARALVRAIKRDDSIRVRTVLLMAFRDLGDAAIAVVPELGKALASAEDEDEAVVLIQGIRSTGRAALAALPQLIEAAVMRDGEAADQAADLVRALGPDALPAIDDVRADADDGTLARLDALRGWIKRPLGRLALDLAAVGDDDSLLLWLHAAEWWKNARRGSYARAAQAIRGRYEAREFAREPTKDVLRHLFEELSKKVVGGKALSYKGREGSTGLTPLGRSLALEVRLYLYEKGLVPRFAST